MRAVVQGMELRRSWERYLHVEGATSDQRLVASTMAWIRDEFAAAAKRHDRHGTARLVRFDVSKLADDTQNLPSLETFAEERGMEEFSQAEQQQAYEDEYGKTTTRQKRRARLIQKQLEALRWLEGLVAQAPGPGDSVAAWLHPTLASKLEAAEIFTLHQLVERINGIGLRWYSGVKGLGKGKAERIVTWLRENESSLGEQLGNHVALPSAKLYKHELAEVVQPATDIRPLEKFIVPAELDGRMGQYRQPQSQCLLKATNDYQAILAWLKSKHGLTPDQKKQLRSRRLHPETGVVQGLDWLQELSHTQRAYRKEAERFLLWCIVHKGKPLSSMTNEDCTEYREFLADPQPRSRWCGDRNRARWSPLWRPFEGPLNVRAQQHALSILKNLYKFLVDQNYLMGNPWSSVTVPRSSVPKVNPNRSFTKAQWKFIQEQLELLPTTSANQRLSLALKLLYDTGLRRSEVVAATVDDLKWVEYPADSEDDEAIEGWMLNVIGKGQKLRAVPVSNEVVEKLSSYLVSRGLSPDPISIDNQGASLLGQASDQAERAPSLIAKGQIIDPRAGVAATTLYKQLKRFFGDCADVLRGQGDVKAAMRIEKASTHWMRHTHASHAIAGGMKVQIAQMNLGHASLATTTIYTVTEAKQHLKAARAFWKGL
jgi:site-specific recombinase XerD